MSSAKTLLPSRHDSPAEWYTTLIRLADLADYGPAKGTMIIKPYGYALWETVQEAMNGFIREKGVGNAYFPLFIPMSLLEKEADHVEGFAPELAVVTHGGGEELEEKLAVRPTSETIMYQSYAKWVQSWRDLPVLMNQWNNVVRWEKRTMPFLRTSEFLWQEGHTAHATREEAQGFQRWAIDMYARIYREWFAMDGYVGTKSTAERFAGADMTMSFESMMPSGKTLQACTSHDLGQNFSKPFGIRFQDEQGAEQHVWQTSWGFSTRSLGGLIMAHGDDNGLVLPPRMAPSQVVVVPVRAEAPLIAYCQQLVDSLKAAGIRAQLDGRDDETFGFKLNKWEVKGVPIVLKIGENERQAGSVTAKARATGEQREWASGELAGEVSRWLDELQAGMLAASQQFMAASTREAATYDEFKQLLAEHKGFVKVHWNDDPEVEATIKEETKAKSSCAPVDWPESEGIDFYTGQPARRQWLFAQSY